MIKDFEKYTHNLTDDELLLIPGFIRSLKKRTSKDMAVTAKEISAAYKKHGLHVDGARVRKMVHHIRMTEKDFMLLASSKGYWTTTNPEEAKDQIESLLHRAFSQIAVANKMKEICESFRELESI